MRDVLGRCYRTFWAAGMPRPGASMGTPVGAGTRPTGAGNLEGVGTPPGLQTDCETLLSRFQEMDSVRFEDFAELWRSMKFATIFWWVCLTLGCEGDAAWVRDLRLGGLRGLPLCSEGSPLCISTTSILTQTFAFRPPPVLFSLNESTVRNKVFTPTLGPPGTDSLSMPQLTLEVRV